MTVAALTVGYLIGSLPTANWWARAFGVDLSGGSGNPGANNARRVGDYRLAAIVLATEIVKGIAAVVAGWTIAGETGALAAGIGAIAGNVVNPWLRFSGGQGLGITSGVLLAAWPAAVLPLVALIALVAKVTKSSPTATIVTMGTALVLSTVWAMLELPNAWGVTPRSTLMVFGLALVVVVVPKQLSRH